LGATRPEGASRRRETSGAEGHAACLPEVQEPLLGQAEAGRSQPGPQEGWVTAGTRAPRCSEAARTVSYEATRSLRPTTRAVDTEVSTWGAPFPFSPCAGREGLAPSSLSRADVPARRAARDDGRGLQFEPRRGPRSRPGFSLVAPFHIQSDGRLIPSLGAAVSVRIGVAHSDKFASYLRKSRTKWSMPIF
jgi:hypothetical protein